MNKKYTILLAAAMIFSGLSSALWAMTIVPTYQDGAGQMWSALQKGVIQQAIDDWQAALPDLHTVYLTLDFTHAGTFNAYLGQWSPSYQNVPYGTDLYPWTTQVVQKINFNVDLFSGANYTWWDSTPTTATDQPFEAWDALSVARHEIGHLLGIADDFYKDNVGQADQFDKWASHITGTTFDPGTGKLNVPLASASDLSHLLDSGTTAGDLMVPALVNGQRRGISATDLNMLHLAYGYTIVPPKTPTTYSLTAIAGKTTMHAGDTTGITVTIYNNGTGSADTLDFSGLSATASGGTLSGSSTSGGPLAIGGGKASNSGLSFTSAVAGSFSISPAATATNHSLGSSATLSSAPGITVKFYSGKGVWNTSGSGTWTDASKWTTLGGVPGIDGALSAADTATFSQNFFSPATVSLNGATPRVAALLLDTYVNAFTIARGTGGTLTLQASSGTALVLVYNGANTISAPVVLGSDAWVGNNYWATINFSGGISGAHVLTVAGGISASSIQVNTLRIGDYPMPSAAVPEPSMLALLAVGVAGLIVYCRRRWKAWAFMRIITLRQGTLMDSSRA